MNKLANIRPILMSTLMVQATLDGRKTQTRRIVNPEIKDCSDFHKAFEEAEWKHEKPEFISDSKHTNCYYCKYCGNGVNTGGGFDYKCPYGKPDDILYVREVYYQYGHWEEVPGVKTKGGRMKWKFVPDSDDILHETPAQYRKGRHHKDSATPAWHKRLARFMPKSAARIWLQVVSVKVERLQDITEADILSEGVRLRAVLPFKKLDSVAEFVWRVSGDNNAMSFMPKGSFSLENPTPYTTKDMLFAHWAELWCDINGRESWDANPWVWVVGYKVLSITGKPANI